MIPLAITTPLIQGPLPPERLALPGAPNERTVQDQRNGDKYNNL